MTRLLLGEGWGMNVEARQRAMAKSIKAAREQARMSQKALAIAVGVDIKTIGRIELMEMVPNLSVIWALADALKVPVQSLVGATPRDAAAEKEARLPEGPLTRAIELLRAEIRTAVDLAQEARTIAEEAKSLAQRRGRNTA